jgi:uncharacterized protein with beta-barrel porin domain
MCGSQPRIEILVSWCGSRATVWRKNHHKSRYCGWIFEYVSDPTLSPVFQALPGASFVVQGAPPVKDSTLASAGAELQFASGISFVGKFDGEFAPGSQTFAGTGSVRYIW